ncbi:MAG TPA: tetratricopeptide repeat protein [Thermoanaerobaculia bacterium]|jgi:Flp pilus assembly protein TadD
MLPATLLTLAIAASIPSGYVDDVSCGSCHAKIVQTYQHVGMSKSFYRPRQGDAIEDFAKLPFRHARSGDVMELRWRNGRLVFRRWRLDAAGQPLHLFEQPVDWILGSGHHARTYLYQTPNGELYQLPLAWYSQTKEWGMAPGYDRPDHEGVLRRARVECLFCHNAYADLLPDNGSRITTGYWRNQTFPAQLPEGIGCQRCHGPGAEHVRKASSGASDAEVRAAIVNVARLEPSLRNDVCYQCHLQPSIAFPGMRRFGRDINSFRPGEPLPSYLLHLDVKDAEIAPDDRFEINHHPYRLEQSRCFRESGGKLSCLSCHDPHKQTADVKPVCMSCHAHAHRASEDCVECHMPKHRTQDVVRVVMTDHRIAIYPNLPALVSPREEREPVIDEIIITDGPRSPADAELYRVVAAVRVGSASAAKRLELMLAATPCTAIEPYFDLATAQLRQKRYPDAEKTAQLILSRVPDQPLALELLGLARGAVGKRDDAIELLRKAAKLDPDRVETQYNLGLQLAARGDRSEAANAFEHALAVRPNFVAAWIHLGDLRDGKDAIAAYERALAIDPSSVQALRRVRGAIVK